MRTKILLVEDDVRLSRIVSRYLSEHEFEIHAADSAKEAYQIMSETALDLALVDLNLPDGHGFDIAHYIRANSSAGIIIISGSGEQVDKIVGLEIGADDYLVKPLDLRELLARVRSVLRRTPQSEVESFASQIQDTFSVGRFDGWFCDFSRHEMNAPDGTPVKLTSQEFRLLHILAKQAGRILSRDKLMDLMKGKEWAPIDRSIDVLIGKIRKKINAIAPDYHLLLTVRGEGYKFAPKIEWVM